MIARRSEVLLFSRKYPGSPAAAEQNGKRLCLHGFPRWKRRAGDRSRFAHFTGRIARQNRPINTRFNSHLKFLFVPLPRPFPVDLPLSAYLVRRFARERNGEKRGNDGEKNRKRKETVLREQWRRGNVKSPRRWDSNEHRGEINDDPGN